MASLTSFEAQIVEVMIRDDPERDVLRAQLDRASIRNRDYSGVGVFSEFVVDADAPKLGTTSRYIQEAPKAHFTHPSLPAGGGAILWLRDGAIHTLECYTYEGSWPEDESLLVVDDL
jgi:hypothetical protein